METAESKNYKLVVEILDVDDEMCSFRVLEQDLGRLLSEAFVSKNKYIINAIYYPDVIPEYKVIRLRGIDSKKDNNLILFDKKHKKDVIEALKDFKDSALSVVNLIIKESGDEIDILHIEITNLPTENKFLVKTIKTTMEFHLFTIWMNNGWSFNFSNYPKKDKDNTKIEVIIGNEQTKETQDIYLIPDLGYIFPDSMKNGFKEALSQLPNEIANLSLTITEISGEKIQTSNTRIQELEVELAKATDKINLKQKNIETLKGSLATSIETIDLYKETIAKLEEQVRGKHSLFAEIKKLETEKELLRNILIELTRGK